MNLETSVTLGICYNLIICCVFERERERDLGPKELFTFSLSRALAFEILPFSPQKSSLNTT